MAKQAYVLIDGAWVPTGGPPGATGPQGPAGPTGAPGAGAPLSNHASYAFSTATTETMVAGAMRLNNSAQASATKLWVAKTSTDGIDISTGLEHCLVGNEVIIQNTDSATKWHIYAVTVDGLDKGTYYEIGIASRALSGTALTAGAVELQRIGTGTIGVPMGGSTAHVLTKTSAADYAIGWAVAASSGHVIMEEGAALTARANLNFVGPVITATDNAGGSRTDVTVSTPNMIVLNATDPVPGGTPVGTIILRTP